MMISLRRTCLANQARFSNHLVRCQASKASSARSKRRTSTVVVKGEILYGFYPVLLALEGAQRLFHCVYYLPTSAKIQEIIDICHSRGIETRSTDRTQLNQLIRFTSQGEGPHKGVCADVSPLLPKAEDWIADEDQLVNAHADRLWLMICSIGDPHNLGAIIRTAYFLGAEKVFTCSPWDCPQATAPFSPIASRASAGTLEIFTPSTILHPEVFLQKMKEKDWLIIGSSLQINQDNSTVGTIHQKKSKLLLIGNEGFGIPSSLHKFCELDICLTPGRQLHERVDSLNVSVATALLIQKILCVHHHGAKE